MLVIQNDSQTVFKTISGFHKNDNLFSIAKLWFYKTFIKNVCFVKAFIVSSIRKFYLPKNIEF